MQPPQMQREDRKMEPPPYAVQPPPYAVQPPPYPVQPPPYPVPDTPVVMPQYEEVPPALMLPTQPPPMVVTTQPPPVYKDYLGLSIVTMILCCLPVGIVALIFSIQTLDSLKRQDWPAASSQSRAAFTCNMIALGLGLCIHLVWIGFMIHFFVAARLFYG